MEWAPALPSPPHGPASGFLLSRAACRQPLRKGPPPTTGNASIPASSFGVYTGTGNVAISAADYTTDSVSSDSAGFNGASVPTSLSACVTYGVLGAQLPEAPSVLLIPASAAAVGLGAVLLVRRRNQHPSQVSRVKRIDSGS